VLLTAEQGLSAAVIHPRQYDLPLLHLAAGCVPAGRGQTEEAERHAALAEQVAASLDYGQERLPAAMARALVCQAAGDYLGMADALGPWQDDAALDSRTRMYAVLRRPLLAEGLLGSGQAGPAATVCGRLAAEPGQAGYLVPALAWLEGWLAELRGAPGRGAAHLPGRRGHRRRRQPGLHRPAAAGPRPATAPHQQPQGRRRAAAPGARPVRGPAGRAVPGPDRTGTGRLRAAATARRSPLGAGDDRPGNRGRPPNRTRHD
jgi:hypothetical protein